MARSTEYRLARFYTLSSSLVIVGTLKTGTAWPVFQFAEPGLAIVAAAALAGLLQGRRATEAANERDGRTLHRFLVVCAVGLVAYSGFAIIHAARGWDDASAQMVSEMVKKYDPGGQALIGPPYYLYLAGRNELGEYADVNIWALRAANGDAKALQLSAAVVRSVRMGVLPVVLEDSRVKRLPGVDAALRANYEMVRFDDPLPSDRAITFWIPKPLS